MWGCFSLKATFRTIATQAAIFGGFFDVRYLKNLSFLD
jgi:hypothetical protein